MQKKTNCCSANRNGAFVISCSGACDLGSISDFVARKLSRLGIRQMKCLAAVGAGERDHAHPLKTRNLLVIDGCNVHCGRKIVEKAGFNDFYYLQVSELGYLKGKTGVTGKAINSVFKIASRLN